MIQTVILAGGLASRLGNLAGDCPKAMLVFDHRPFLEYQLELMKAQGYKRFLFCIGHLGEQIESYFEEGSHWGVEITYSHETEALLGTGGALKHAEALLEDHFFVMYGDAYLKLDFRAIEDTASKNQDCGLMVVYRNDNHLDRSNLIVQDGSVIDYGYENFETKHYIDEGVSVLRKNILEAFPTNKPFPLGDVFKKLVKEKRLRAFETQQRFYEVGSKQGYEEFKALVEKGDL